MQVFLICVPLIPLSFDARHTLNLNVDYRFEEGSKYNGPKIGAVPLLENTGLNVVLTARSGTPYTRQTNANPMAQFGIPLRNTLDGSINGSRLPWSFRVDTRLDRNIKIFKGADGKAPKYLNVYLMVQNLLNTQNIQSVYAYTGSAYDDGYLVSPEGITALENLRDVDAIANAELSADDAIYREQAFRDMYDIRIKNPSYFSKPRRIRLGVIFNF